VVNYASSKVGADQVVAAITEGGGKAIAVKADVSKAAEAKALIDDTLKAFGRVDVLVNNSGVYEFAPLEEITEDSFHRMFNTNVLGLLLVSQAAAKHLPEGGSVINVGSVVSRTTPSNTAVYTATKGAVDAITGVLSREFGPRKIRFNSINPGMVDTEGARALGVIGSDFEKVIAAQAPFGRSGQPEEIADIAVFLASKDSRWMTGETLIASGGFR
jgi:3-oxoacyl-[acyl-carrier protein] reductase